MWWFGEKENWRLVSTIEYGNKISGVVRGKEVTGSMWYHLFESNKGQRQVKVKVDIVGADAEKIEAFGTNTKIYHTKIYRWLAGRGDPDILRYSEVDQEEVMHELRGYVIEPDIPGRTP